MGRQPAGDYRSSHKNLQRRADYDRVEGLYSE